MCNFETMADFSGVKRGNTPSGDNGEKAIVPPPCCNKQSEQGRRWPAVMQSRWGKLGLDGSSEGFP